MENIIDRAIIFATNAHSGTMRKGTTIPYIVHPMEAGAIAAGLTDDYEVIAAAADDEKTVAFDMADAAQRSEDTVDNRLKNLIG